MLSARNIGAILQKQGIGEACFVGHVERACAEEFVKKMAAAGREISCTFAGDALTEPETAENLGQTDRYILLAENQTTGFRDIDQTLTLLKAWGKTALGVVIIDQ